MASIIRIKRSSTAGNPAVLAAGELAYSALENNDINGGDRLYVGIGTETSGNAANHIVVGGKYFTDLLDHTRGTLTASSALIADANSKLDNLKVDNLDLNGNTITSTDANGNIVLDPNGTGYVSIVGTNGVAIPVGTTSQRGPNVQGTIRYNTETSSFEGYSGSTWGSLGGVKSVDGLTYISAESSPGLSDDTLKFVTDGTEAMSLDKDSLDVASKILTTNINSTLTSTSTTTGALVVDGGVGIAENLNVGGVINIDNLRLDTNTLSSTNTNGDISITPNGSGKLILNNPYINGTTDTLAEFIYDTVGGAVTSGTGITVTNSDNANTSTINITNTAVTAGSYGSTTAIPTFTVNAQGQLTAASTQNISTTLNIAGDTGTDAVAHLTDTLTFTGGEGIDTLVTNNTLTISAEDASSVNKGVASFDSTDFSVSSGNVTLNAERVEDIVNGLLVAGEGIDLTYNDAANTLTIDAELATTTNAGVASFDSGDFSVSSGAVSIKTAGVDNAQLVNSSVTFGSTTVSLGSTSLTLAGIQQLDVDNIRIDGNTISATDANGGITLAPNGSGHISANFAKIQNVAAPTQAQDAANKAYVDAVAEGLHVHASVKAATTTTLEAHSGGTATYDNGTNGSGATITLSTGISILDGYSLVNGDRVLIKNQANAAHNGIYVRTSSTIFTRAADFDTVLEVASGDFLFVSYGTANGKTGWVQTVQMVTFGSTNITFEQFSGAGTYTAGQGLSLTGTTFDIVLNTNGGLEIVSDELGLKSSTAGNGLTFNNGVLAVVGTSDRITVGADSIDIASTYVGQNTITTLGTISSGTWQGTTIGAPYGGTGQSSYTVGDLLVATANNALSKLNIGTAGQVLQVAGNGTSLTYGDVDGGIYA